MIALFKVILLDTPKNIESESKKNARAVKKSRN